jgi:hypothetical protein
MLGFSKKKATVKQLLIFVSVDEQSGCHTWQQNSTGTGFKKMDQ